MRPGRTAAAALILLLAVIGAARADTASAVSKPSEVSKAGAGSSAVAGNALPAHVVTEHSMMLDGNRLDYQAIAETLPLTDAKGEENATVYVVAYLAAAPAGTSRPRAVSFVFNGGPGAASVYLHLGAIGPRIMESPASGAAPPPPVRLIDNPSTWLAFSDLVFIDPVGTGFSRGIGKGDNPSKPFWDVKADLASLSAVVRLWLTRHQRWDAPIYLVGESYGGFRVATLAHELADRVGVTVSGLVMISPALDLSVLHSSERDLLAAAVELPSYAASAAALAGHPVDLAAVEHFALSDELVGLANLKGRPVPDDPFIARLAQITGLPADIVARTRGRIPRQIFAREIRRPERETVSLYDATVTRPANPYGDRAGDVVLDAITAAYTAAYNIYAPEVLGYHTDQPYRVLPHEVIRNWNWDDAEQDDDGLGLAMGSLEAALLAHPTIKVLIANGRYDLVTPYLGSRWLVDQLAVPEAVRAGIRLRVYPGGHMMYTRPASRAALAADAAALYQSGYQAGDAAPAR